MLLALTLSVIGLLFINSISNEILGKPSRIFVYRTVDGSAVRANVSFNPRYNDEKVSRFLHRVVDRCFSIDINSAQLLLAGEADNPFMKCVNDHFSPLAASTLYNSYPQDKLVETVAETEASANAVVALPPVLIDRNKPDASLKWVFSVPITVTIQSVSADQTTSFVAIFTVVPDSNAHNPSNLTVSKAEFH